MRSLEANIDTLARLEGDLSSLSADDIASQIIAKCPAIAELVRVRPTSVAQPERIVSILNPNGSGDEDLTITPAGGVGNGRICIGFPAGQQLHIHEDFQGIFDQLAGLDHETQAASESVGLVGRVRAFFGV